jgi:hypothetical protein
MLATGAVGTTNGECGAAVTGRLYRDAADRLRLQGNLRYPTRGSEPQGPLRQALTVAFVNLRHAQSFSRFAHVGRLYGNECAEPARAGA